MRRAASAVAARPNGSPLRNALRHSMDFEKNDPRNPDSNVMLQYDHTFQQLQTKTLGINKQAYGVPFLVTDEGAVDAACKHHGASVKIHKSEKLLMPFWFFQTSCGGRFEAEVLRPDLTAITPHQNIWVQSPTYEYSFPFGDHCAFNQVSASYLHHPSLVEGCLAGSHVPSMLVQRFELLEELEAMEVKAKLIPFVMSTTSALRVAEARHTRDMVLTFVEKELKKYHGSFKKANITLKGLRTEANQVRPVFLPMYHMVVSTGFSGSLLPTYICGATGKSSGAVLSVPKSKRNLVCGVASAVSIVSTAPVFGPEIATTAAIGSVFAASFLLHLITRLNYAKQQSLLLGSLQVTGLLNFSDDQNGYRWTVEQEEQSEYEYREELRRRARKKSDFEERIKEEYARDEARARGMKFDPKNRKRYDLKDVDPLGYYEILGLKGKETGSTIKDVQQAFREESKKHHPDLNSGIGEDDAKRKMQAILEAYKILKDPKTKKEYDSGKMKKKDGDDGEGDEAGAAKT